MTVLMFFSPDTVISDINEKAIAIQNGYEVDSCKIYDTDQDGVRWLGYAIEKDHKTFIVKMEYAENENGQLAIKNRQWKVFEAGERAVGGFMSLGEVFTLLSISKRQYQE